MASAVLASWGLDGRVIALLLVATFLYGRGWLRGRRSNAGELACFLGGLTALFLALESPLDAFDTLFLSAHMTQHLLMMIAPPLLLLGNPVPPLLRGLPRSFLREGLAPFLAWSEMNRAHGHARNGAMRIRLALAGLCFAALLFADGGAIQFRQQAGPLVIAVFGAPSPLRVGAADLNVLIQNQRDREAVLDAEVGLELSRPGEKPIRLRATRAQAANKLLYAANPVLPSAGDWRLGVQVKVPRDSVALEGTIAVRPRQESLVSYWLYIAFVPAAMVLFVVNQWLEMRLRRVRKSPLPAAALTRRD